MTRMYRYLILWIFFIVSYDLLGQNIYTNHLKEQPQFIQNESNEPYSKKVTDSLQRELFYYKVKDDFYTQALSNQSTLYSVVVTIIMTLIAVVGGFTTFGFIQSRFKKSEQEIIEVRNTIFQLFSIINENVLEASAYHFRRMGLEYEN